MVLEGHGKVQGNRMSFPWGRKFQNLEFLEIPEPGNPRTRKSWKSQNLEISEPGFPGNSRTWKPQNLNFLKFQNLKFQNLEIPEPGIPGNPTTWKSQNLEFLEIPQPGIPEIPGSFRLGKPFKTVESNHSQPCQGHQWPLSLWDTPKQLLQHKINPTLPPC